MLKAIRISVVKAVRFRHLRRPSHRYRIFYYFREMRFIHFPFFILSAIAFSCAKEEPSMPAADYTATLQTATKYSQQKQYDSAFYYFNKAKNEKGITADQRVYALLNMADIQRMFSDFSGSEATITDALPDVAKTNSDYTVSAYNLLGIVTKEQSDYKNAIRYYKLCLDYTKDSLQQAIIKNNMAVVYMDELAFDKAVESLTPLLKISAVTANVETHARLLDNLGYCYFKTGKQNEGLELLDRSLQKRLKIKDDFGLVSSYFHLSQVHKNSDLALSGKYARLAYRTATHINSPDDRLETLAQLIKTTDGPEVKKYGMIHIALNDSVRNINQAAKNQFAKIRYDDARTKAENANLKIEKARIESTNVLLLVAGILSIVIFILLYTIIRTRHKKEKQDQVHKTEKDISKKIHDVLANDLYNAMAFAKTQPLEKPEKKELLMRHLNSIYLATRDIAHQTGDIETGADYLTALSQMMQLYNDDDSHITIKGVENVDWTRLSANAKRTIYRLVQELLVNMKKHSSASVVLFDFSLADKKLTIGYKDNGDFEQDSNVLAKVMRNVENHIQTIDGRVIFDENSGRVNIEIPVK